MAINRELDESEIKNNQETFFKWLDKTEHLPHFLRDFHDQKDVFKLIDARISENKDPDGINRGQISWVDAHIYTIDSFLRVMAEFGYTLQRSKKAIAFNDIQEMVSQQKKKDSEKFASMLMKKEDV